MRVFCLLTTIALLALPSSLSAYTVWSTDFSDYSLGDMHGQFGHTDGTILSQIVDTGCFIPPHCALLPRSHVGQPALTWPSLNIPLSIPQYVYATMVYKVDNPTGAGNAGNNISRLDTGLKSGLSSSVGFGVYLSIPEDSAQRSTHHVITQNFVIDWDELVSVRSNGVYHNLIYRIDTSTGDVSLYDDGLWIYMYTNDSHLPYDPDYFALQSFHITKPFSSMTDATVTINEIIYSTTPPSVSEAEIAITSPATSTQEPQTFTTDTVPFQVLVSMNAPSSQVTYTLHKFDAIDGAFTWDFVDGASWFSAVPILDSFEDVFNIATGTYRIIATVQAGTRTGSIFFPSGYLFSDTVTFHSNEPHAAFNSYTENMSGAPSRQSLWAQNNCDTRSLFEIYRNVICAIIYLVEPTHLSSAVLADTHTLMETTYPFAYVYVLFNQVSDIDDPTGGATSTAIFTVDWDDFGDAFPAGSFVSGIGPAAGSQTLLTWSQFVDAFEHPMFLDIWAYIRVIMYLLFLIYVYSIITSQSASLVVQYNDTESHRRITT